VAYITFAALGLVFQGYFFSFHLLHVARDNDLLTRVLQAVTKNGKTLLWVALLTLIIIYIYSLIAYAFYRETYDPNDGLLCSTLFECLLTTLNFGQPHRGQGGTAGGAPGANVAALCWPRACVRPAARAAHGRRRGRHAAAAAGRAAHARGHLQVHGPARTLRPDLLHHHQHHRDEHRLWYHCRHL